MSNRNKGDLGRMIWTNLERIMPQNVIFLLSFLSLCVFFCLRQVQKALNKKLVKLDQCFQEEKFYMRIEESKETVY